MRVCPAPPGHARRVVAEFRAAVTCYSDDPDIRRLVDEPRIVVGGFDAKPAEKHSLLVGRVMPRRSRPSRK